MTNKKYFIGNWKMFGDINSFKIVNKINQFSLKSLKHKNAKITLCIPNTLIQLFKNKLGKSKSNRSISLGAQNCHYSQTYGPYTGFVNASMLRKAGADFVILGHSENRHEGETNNLIKKKIESSLNQKLNIIFCIGETLKEKNKGKTFYVLKKQIKDSLKKNYNINKILIAYEPVWSIGTNKLLKANDLQKIIIFIKNELKKIFKTKMNPRVLYGGSVNQNNIKIFSPLDEIDGFLIGGASQSPKKFIDIIKNYYK
tara:strand:- start:1856 stop:2623 length:768 start_codon:yes stop_codon:yes gene_type:complete